MDSRLVGAFRAALPWAAERFRLYMTSGRYWLVVLTASFVTGFAGPFGAQQALNAPARMLFWAVLLIPLVALIMGISLVLRETARNLSIGWAWAALAAGLLAVPPVVVYSDFVGKLFLPPENQLSLSYILSHSSLTAVVLTVVVNAFFPTLQPIWRLNHPRPRHVLPPGHEDFGVQFGQVWAAQAQSQVAALPRQAPEASPLFERLPAELGFDIVCIRADNHHIEVTTPLGVARILMRLGDAEADLAPYPGMRVHRSWWVNLAHVTTMESGTSAGATELVLSTGTRVPVSRGQRAAVTAALGLQGSTPAA